MGTLEVGARSGMRCKAINVSTKVHERVAAAPRGGVMGGNCRETPGRHCFCVG